METSKNGKSFKALPLAFELGFTIALPLALFAFFGRLVDKAFSTTPLFLLSGIGIALAVTTYFIYKKVKSLQP